MIRDINRPQVLRFTDEGAEEYVIIEGQRENMKSDTEARRLGPLVEDIGRARRRDIRVQRYIERSTWALTVIRDYGSPSSVAG